MPDITLARTADALTLFRAVLAVPLAVSAAFGWWRAVGILLTLSWWSDFFDGRAARRSSRPTRLGTADMAIDMIIGVAVVTGLLVGGWISPWLAAPAAILAAAYWWRRNPAWSMLVQAIGYGAALWHLGHQDNVGFMVATGSILSIAVLDRSRLFGFVLPSFFRGIIGRHEDAG